MGPLKLFSLTLLLWSFRESASCLQMSPSEESFPSAGACGGAGKPQNAWNRLFSVKSRSSSPAHLGYADSEQFGVLACMCTEIMCVPV